MDKILEAIDPLGKYQKLSLFLVGSLCSLSAMIIYSTIFTLAEPKLNCYHDNNESNYTDLDDRLITNKSICELVIGKRNNSYKCEFDKTYFGRTIVTDWFLLCERRYLANLTQSFQLFGSFMIVITGYLSDRYGRKRITISSLILIFLTLFITQLTQIEALNLAFLPKYIIYSISQIFLGLLALTLYSVPYIFLFEITTTKYHILMTNMCAYAFIFGELIVLVVSYFSRNWLIINWFMTIFAFILIIPCGLLLKESPRLLYRKCKYDKAIKLLNEIDKFNNKNKIIENDLSYKEMLIEENKQRNITDRKGNFLKEVISSKKMFIKTLLLSFLWICMNLMYYGITLGITEYNDSINPYLTYIFSIAAEIVGYTLCFLNNKFGRRKPNIVFLFISAVVFIMVSFLPKYKNWLSGYDAVFMVCLTLIGKCMIAAPFNSTYNYTSEQYSSQIRGTALLFFLCCGRTGSLVAPQINLLSSLLWKQLPYIIFSVAAMLSAIIYYLLPESKGHS